MKWKSAGQAFLIVTGLIVIAAIVYSVVKEKRKKEVEGASDDANVRAFLKMIQLAEGTYGDYHIVFGGAHFNNMSDHPAVTGEWTGKRLSDEICIAAGQQPGCKSTAAGAYQIIKPTWLSLKEKLDLKDFTPISQNLAAIELIREKGALDDVKAGRVEDAINKVRFVWASLPGNSYRQPTKTLAELKVFYQSNGGNFS